VKDLVWLWPLLRPHRWRVITGCVAVLVQTGIGLSFPYLVKIAIDRAVIPENPSALVVVVAAYLALVLIRSAAATVEIVTVGRIGQRALHTLRVQIFDRVQRQSLDFHRDEGPGGIVARVVGDVDSLSALLTDGLVRLATSVLTIMGVAVLLVTIGAETSWVLLAAVPFFTALVLWFRHVSTPAWRAVRATAARAMAAWEETIATAALLRGFGTNGGSFEVLTSTIEEEATANRRTVDVSSRFFPAVELISAATTVTAIVHGGFAVLDDRMEIGTLTAVLLYLRLAFGPVAGLSQLFDSVQAGLAGARRLRVVMDQRPQPPASSTPIPLPKVTGELRFEHVGFAYRTGPTVLQDITWTIRPGASVALVGATGAGKSTIAKLILRLYDPSAGRILLDGVDLRDLTETDLRRVTAFVPQETNLFSGTVADNIALSRDHIHLAHIETVLREMGAWDSLGHLLNTDVGRDGARLSAAQRQLIAVARVWVANPAVLVLDEASNRLDHATDTLVRSALRRIRHGRTTIIIAHRIAAAMDADQVAVLAAGTIAEAGPPGELLDRGGLFAQLHAHSSMTPNHQFT
jgi:ATP-binding cassette subfamily B protein